jgi:di/tricarboxylate transporter
MGVALATSMAFLTPLGHPVNVLVMGPGGYRFRDYLRVGLPLTLLLFGVVMVFLPIFWPLAVR